MLRQKALHLGVLVAGMLIAIGLDVGAALTNLGSERKDLDQQLKIATTGAARASPTTTPRR